MCVTNYNTLNLHGALDQLNMDSKTCQSKPASDVCLEVVKLKDSYLEFTSSHKFLLYAPWSTINNTRDETKS